MRCPKCRCEVGNQSVCPYCGATVYMGTATWDMNTFQNRATVPVPGSAKVPLESRGTERKLRNLETKVNLLLVLQTGTFVLAVLSLIIMALK